MARLSKGAVRRFGGLRVVGSVALLAAGIATSRVGAAPGDPPVRASAFVDLNADGQWQPGEVTFVDLTVTAYDPAGGSAVGVLNGAGTGFDIDVSGLSGSDFRLEYSGLSDPFRWGAQGSGADAALVQGGSSVQFVASGDSVAVAVDEPNTFCQDNPALATNCFVAGDQLTDANSARSTVVGVGYDWGNDVKNPSDPANPETGGVENIDTWQVDQNGVPNDPRSLALASQVGSTWGEAWNRYDGYLYVSSFLKMFAGYGAEGPNAIYRIPMDPYTGQATGVPELFARVGNSTGLDPATGTISKAFPATGGTDGVSVCDDLHGADITSPVYDPEVFANVYKCSFGDMDVSADGTRLFVTSLKGKEILEFDTATGNLVAQHPVPVNNVSSFCPNVNVASDVWPFGLGLRGSEVFAGGVCGAVSTTAGTNVWVWVMKLDLTSGTWSTAYKIRARDWRNFGSPWIDSYTALRNYFYPGVGEFGVPNVFVNSYDPQVSDIEFFGDDLTVGLRGRSGDQLGFAIPDPNDPDPSDNELVFSHGHGDLMCLWWDGSAFQTESGGTCGPGRAWQNPLGGQDPATYSNGGPGRGETDAAGKGDEFYWGDGANDLYPGNPATPNDPRHDEPVFGGLSQVNTSPLAFTGLNPPDALGGEMSFTGGIGWADSVNGSTFKAYLIYEYSDLSNLFSNVYFGKANGLGDLEELCVAAPVEIGNRVWFDDDRDGVQDAGEGPVVGATVRLYAADGSQIAETVTDSQGRYVFASMGPDGLPGNADDLFAPADQVTVRLDNPVDFAAGGVLAGYQLTVDSATDGSNPTADDQDSDGVSGNSLAVPAGATRLGVAAETSVTVGAAGENDHTWDFGFFSVPNTYSLGNLVWNDANNNGVVDAGESGIDGVTVNVYVDADGDGVADSATPVATVVTTSGGHWLVNDLPAGGYVVEVVAPSGLVSSTGGGVTGTGSGFEPAPDPDTDTDDDDNGTGGAGTSVWSATVTLGGVDPEPTGEGATPGFTDNASDDHSNVTVDIGLWRPYALGNVVFEDVNNNGVQDPGEPGINGVTVNLFTDPDGDGVFDTLVRSTVTATADVDGEYRFVDLPAGNYVVEVVPPAGYSSSTGPNGQYEAAPDPDDDVNLDDNGTFDAALGTIRSLPVTLGPGDEPIGEEPGAGDPADESYNKTVDFGLFRAVSLGDLVWSDLNDNGMVDPGEPGLDGVTVNLYDDPDGDGVFDHLVDTVTTTGGGLYQFTGLNPGDYVVGFVLPADSRSSTDAATGADPDDDVNNDDNLAGTGTGEVFSAPITLAFGSEPTTDGDADTGSNLSLDAGVFTPNPAVSVKKYTNGCDAQTGSGATGPTATCPADDGQNNPVVATGAGVTWTYVVTNTGNTPLSDVTVTDDKLPAGDIDCGTGSNVVAALAPGASVTCAATGVALAGQYTNTATVDAQGETAPGVTGALEPVTDPSNYFGAESGLTIKKYTTTSNVFASGAADDADVAAGADPTGNHVVAAGDNVWWHYVITNTGNTDITGIAVTDDQGVVVTCPATTLAAGASMTCTASGALLNPGQYTNVGSVTGVDAVSGSQLTGSDPSNAFVAVPGVSVKKFTNGVDADTPAEAPQVGVGSQVSWTYVVHNTGNVTLADIVVTDDKEGTVTCPATVLSPDDGAPGGADEMTCTRTGVATEGAYANVATVSGTPADPTGVTLPGATPVMDDDPSHYVGVAGTIGDLVFEDLDGDGVQDPGEPGIPGVTVILFDGAGNEITRTVTGPDGTYLFTGLPAGDYQVGFVPPAGWLVSPLGGTPDGGLDSNADPTTGLTPVFVLNPGATDLTWDAGLWRPVSVGNLVWADNDNDGTVDTGEPGLDGVTVTLLSDQDGDGTFTDVVATQVTSSGGFYLFTNLVPGDYQLAVAPLAGMSSSTGGGSEPAPDVDADSDDSDDNGTAAAGTVTSAVLTLTGGEPTGEPATPGHPDTVVDDRGNHTVDFGFFTPVSLGDLVWADTNDNGQVDAGEAGIEGVAVTLLADLDGDGVFTDVVAETATDPSGNWVFTGLAPGTYVVQFTLPTDGRSSTDAATGADPDDDVNGDDNIVGTPAGVVQTSPITLVSGGEPVTDGDSDPNSNLSVDVGVFTPQPGVAVKKYTNGCDAQDATGASEPTAVCPGDDGKNNPVVPAGGTITWTYVVTNTGNVPLSQVTVSDDKVPAGDIDCGAGSNVVATLAPAASATCVATGVAAAGQYTNTATVTAEGETTPGQTGAVTPATDPSNYFGADPGLAIKKYTTTTDAFAVGAAGVADDADVAAGADPVGNHVVGVGAKVWWHYVVSNTGNTIITGIAVTDDQGVAVTCPATSLDAGDSMTCVASGTLDTPGQYTNIGSVTGTDGTSGEELSASDPSNVFVADPGVEVVKATNGEDANTPADAAQVDAGQQVTWTYLVHNTGNVALANVVVIDDKEGVISCPKLMLAPDDGAPGGADEMTCVHTGTAVGGGYTNNATVSGVPVDSSGNPIDGVDPVSDDDPSNYIGETATIGDTIWVDSNVNGVQDPGETPLEGVTVTLLDGAGNPVPGVDPVVTGPDGQFLFDNLPPGDYQLQITPPAGWVITPPGVGGNPATDSDADPATGITPVTTLDGGETDLTWDTGLYQPVSLGDLVWQDSDNNGVVNGSEAGVDGLAVTLLGDTDHDGAIDDIVATQTTSDGGHYLFTGLVPGDYQVQLVVPAGWVSSTGGGSEPGPDADVDADDNDDNGALTAATVITSNPVTLTMGGEPTGEPVTPGHSDGALDANSNVTVDFGIYQPLVSVGDTVFADANDNGVLDPGETGIPGVTVTLLADLDGDGTFDDAVDSVVTGPEGDWVFTDLTPGDYVIQVELPTDGRSSTDAATGTDPDDDVNNDDNIPGTGTGVVQTAPFTLGENTEPVTDGDTDPDSNLTVDIGVFIPQPGVSVKKFTNGCDAQSATGETGPAAACPGDDGQNNPVVAAGAAVTWTYVVTNTGNTPLTDVVVSDDKVAAADIDCGDGTNTVDALGVGGTVTCTATGTAAAGQYTNTATVTAVGETTPGQTGPVTPGTDPSNYFGSNPGLGIKKYTTTTDTFADGSADDADVAAGNNPAGNHVVAVGAPVWWHYVITNTGNTTMTGISVTDDQVSDITCPADELAPGETMTCVATGTLDTPGQYTNVGSVTGTDGSTGATTGASDPSNTFVADPSVTVEKSTNGADADTPADAPIIGTNGEVTWTYVVTNTGNVTLVDLAVTDDREGDITCPTTTLDPGATMTCVHTGVAIDGDYANNATVTGTPADEAGEPLDGVDPVTSTDPSHYTGIPVVIGDAIWLDRDHDGVQDPDEPGIPGVELELHDAEGNVIGSTTTDDDGHYQFDNSNTDGLAPDTDYTIEFPESNFGPGGPLDGLEPTDMGAGDVTTDSDIGPDGTIGAHTPSSGEDLTFDGGWVYGPSDLTIDKELGTTTLGQVTFTVVVTNLGPNTARGPIRVVDPMPDALNAVSAEGDEWTCEVETKQITCDWPHDLQVDQSPPVINLVTELDPTKPAPKPGELIVNRAVVSGENTLETRYDNNADSAEIDGSALVNDGSVVKPTSPPVTTTPTTTVGRLALTGAKPLSWVLIGASLVLAGSTVLAGRRRRIFKP